MAEFSPTERDERAKCFRDIGWTGKQLMEVAVHLQRIETGSVDAHLQEEMALPAAVMKDYRKGVPPLAITLGGEPIESFDELAEVDFDAVVKGWRAWKEANAFRKDRGDAIKAFTVMNGTTDAALEDKAPYRRQPEGSMGTVIHDPNDPERRRR
jgi:hypothetical protein